MSNINQPRHQRGARVAGRNAGGEWAQKTRTAALGDGLSYSSLSGADAQREAIFDRLERSGSVPATTVESATNPRYTDGIDVWWQQHFERMEQSPGGAYDVMPDDYTPSHTSGNALSGNRRTHRIRYAGAGVEIRMPSATAIKRFSAEHGRRTFDVPVEMSHEGGVVSGFVRVTEGAAGAWEVQALNFPGKSAGRVSESVACVLEARRPSMALRQAEAQYEARQQLAASGPVAVGASPLHQRMLDRMASRGTPMYTTRVRSGVVRSVGYDAATKTLSINLNGRTYGYRTSKDVFLEIVNGHSPGFAYNQLVKNRADRVAISKCSKCQRVSLESVAHTCPAPITRPKRSVAFRSTVATLLLNLPRARKTG